MTRFATGWRCVAGPVLAGSAAAIGLALAGLSPALAEGLGLRETAPGAADGAIETIAGWGLADGAVFQAAAVDLNGDAVPEWIVRVEHIYQCRRTLTSCRTYVMRRLGNGSWDGIAYPYASGVAVLPSLSNGFHDLAFDDAFYRFDGAKYRQGEAPVAAVPTVPPVPAAPQVTAPQVTVPRPAPPAVPPTVTPPSAPAVSAGSAGQKTGGHVGKAAPAGSPSATPAPAATAPVPLPPATDRTAQAVLVPDIPVPPPPPGTTPAPAAPAQLNWTTYVNPRFGIRLDYPKGVFLPNPPPENGDGQSFDARDGASRFSVWGSNNVLAATAQSAMDSFAAGLMPGAIRSSRRTDAGGFETVALRDGKLVFHAEIVTADVIFGFEAELDDPGAGAMGDVFRRMMQSLRGPEPQAAAGRPPAVPPPLPPPPGSLYDTLVATARAGLEPAIGQALGLRVKTLRRAGIWAYLYAMPTRPDGTPLDWLATPFARDWRADMMSDRVMVLMLEENGAWRVVDQVVGPTDVYWLGWVAQYGLPETLFYVP